MTTKTYESPSMTEIEILVEQTFLQSSLGFGDDNQAGPGMGQTDWGEY